MQSILVVDDDFAMRRGIALMLRGAGYRVFEAEDRSRAALVLGEHTIDLAVIDLFLDRDDGVLVAEFVQQKNPDTKVLILTANVDHERAQAAQRLFGECFLEKSSLEQWLLKRIEIALRTDKKQTVGD
jgi:two-component system KDP operon response regulator KdpE